MWGSRRLATIQKVRTSRELLTIFKALCILREERPVTLHIQTVLFGVE